MAILRDVDGKSLKLKRVAADVKGIDLARAMGISGSRVSAIENSRVVQPDTIERYERALATLTTSTTPAEAVA